AERQAPRRRAQAREAPRGGAPCPIASDKRGWPQRRRPPDRAACVPITASPDERRVPVAAPDGTAPPRRIAHRCQLGDRGATRKGDIRPTLRKVSPARARARARQAPDAEDDETDTDRCTPRN